MRRRTVVIAAAGILVGTGAIAALTTPGTSQRSRPASAPRQAAAPGVVTDGPPPMFDLPLRDPRFPFPVAPTTMTLEQHAEMAAASRINTFQTHPPEPGQVRDEAEQRTLDELSERLQALDPVPDARRAYFAWLERPDCPVRFHSWGCFLVEATPIPGGWWLKVRAMARAIEPTWGQYYSVYNRFIEEYTLTEASGLRFLRGYPHPDDPGTPSFGRTGI